MRIVSGFAGLIALFVTAGFFIPGNSQKLVPFEGNIVYSIQVNNLDPVVSPKSMADYLGDKMILSLSKTSVMETHSGSLGTRAVLLTGSGLKQVGAFPDETAGSPNSVEPVVIQGKSCAGLAFAVSGAAVVDLFFDQTFYVFPDISFNSPLNSQLGQGSFLKVIREGKIPARVVMKNHAYEIIYTAVSVSQTGGGAKNLKSGNSSGK